MNPLDEGTTLDFPKPSKDYLAKREDRRVLEAGPQNATKANQLYNELEQQFMKAWNFSPDAREQAERLRGMLRNKVEGFDHCTFYYDARTAMLVIVTQPHYDPTEMLEEGLRLGNWFKPAVIPAHEWSFYYPKTGYLVVVRFPRSYASAIRALNAACK